jgi:hypothetical protein
VFRELWEPEINRIFKWLCHVDLLIVPFRDCSKITKTWAGGPGSNVASGSLCNMSRDDPNRRN